MKKYTDRSYRHFDARIELIDNEFLPEEIRGIVENPEEVVKHGFYPFIRFVKKTYKYKHDAPKEERRQKEVKGRDIMYAAHIDRYIYQHYCYLLSGYYNRYAADIDIDEVATAYRSGSNTINKGKNNVDFAIDVIGFIRKERSEKPDCVVFVTDFHKYFDNIDSALLKQQMECVMGVERLPEDIYRVYRSLTKYCCIDYDDILKYYRRRFEPKITRRKFKREGNAFFTIEQFREFKDYLKKETKKLQDEQDQQDKQDQLRSKPFVNTNGYGIPQGSPLSALLSNIYLIDFDKAMKDFAEKNQGLYRRYCDDIIIVIPVSGIEGTSEVLSDIERYFEGEVSRVQGLSVSADKTRRFFHTADSVIEFDTQFEPIDGHAAIDYLGFVYDGKSVKMREKSVTNYYRKLYRMLHVVCRCMFEFDRGFAYRQRFYSKFTIRRARENPNVRKKPGGEEKTKGKKKTFGNFIHYAMKAHRKFGELSEIKPQIDGHWQKINRIITRRKKAMSSDRVPRSGELDGLVLRGKVIARRRKENIGKNNASLTTYTVEVGDGVQYDVEEWDVKIEDCYALKSTFRENVYVKIDAFNNQAKIIYRIGTGLKPDFRGEEF